MTHIKQEILETLYIILLFTIRDYYELIEKFLFKFSALFAYIIYVLAACADKGGREEERG